MRSLSRFEAQWSATWAVILVSVGAFIVQNASPGSHIRSVFEQFTLSLDGLKHGHVWQLVTSQFLHAPINDGGAFHLLSNMFLIYVLGQVVEKALGNWGFLALYLAAGALGGALQMLGGFFWPARFGIAVVGASASVCGLIAAFAVLYPQRKLSMFFFPVAIRGQTLFGLALLVSLLGCVYPLKTSGVAHCAHLGGLVGGLAFIWWRMRKSPLPLLPESRAVPAFIVNPALD